MSLWNHRTLVTRTDDADLQQWMEQLPELFAKGEGILIHDGRNQLRKLSHGGTEYVVKAYQRPHFINRMVYGVLRASKAKRAYDNAVTLQQIGIGSPTSVGYMNLRRGLLFDRSYLVTVASACPYCYTDLFTADLPFADEVLRAVGRLTACLHEHGLTHKDYSRGNILFAQRPDGSIQLELVDLNRMAHGPVSMKAGCKNFERLPATPRMHRLMAETYAAARGFDPEQCYRLMQAFRAKQPDKIDHKY